jgi:VWFA-related protein
MARRSAIHRAPLLAMLCAVALTGPSRARAQETLFKSGVDMVALTVTVVDGAGHSVIGLTHRDFAIYEEGVQQPLALFGSEQVPVDVVFVLDTSSSMTTALPLAKKAAGGLVGQLRADDRAEVVDVKGSVGIPQPLTQEHASVVAAIDRLSARGSTAMHDGVYTTLREFARERRSRPEMRRQALVLLSDGMDTTSHVSFDDVIMLARHEDVTIYTIALRNPIDAAVSTLHDTIQEAAYAMRALATETGGLAFFPASAQELESIYASIARELTSQYALGRRFRGIEPASLRRLQQYRWPGNIRQLKNVIEETAVLCDHEQLHVPPEGTATAGAGGREGDPFQTLFADSPTLEELTKRYISHLLSTTRGNMMGAAAILGVDRRTLYRMVARYQLGAPALYRNSDARDAKRTCG